MRSIAVSNKMLSAAQASYEGSPEYGLTDSDMRKAIKMALREAPDQQSDLAAARAEIERLTKERDDAVLWRDHYQRQLSAEKLSFQRRAAGLWQPIYDKARGDAEKAEAERDDARSMLADAERDMRQRAAKVARYYGAQPAPLNDGCGSVILKAVYGPDVAKAILALPLKHADREGGK